MCVGNQGDRRQLPKGVQHRRACIVNSEPVMRQKQDANMLRDAREALKRLNQVENSKMRRVRKNLPENLEEKDDTAEEMVYL